MESINTTHLLSAHKYLFIFIFSLLLYHPANAQNHPYPQSPENRASVNTSSPTLSWKGGKEFSRYTIEVFEADYKPGNNFNSLNLQNYKLTYAVEGNPGYEASGLAYHELRENIYITIDDQSSGILSFNNSFDLTGREDVSSLNGNQHEGISYLYNDYFVSVEETTNQLVFARFNYGANDILSSVSLINKVRAGSSNFGNRGYEGITYNPVTNKMYMVKEYDPLALYEFNAPISPNFNQPVSLSQPFNIENSNWAPNDLAGLYHLSLNKAMSATATGEHLLLLSEESFQLLEIDLKGNLISQKKMYTNELPNINNDGFFKAEGVAYNNGVIWVASEGTFSTPAFYYGFVNKQHQNPSTTIKKSIYKKENIYSTTHKIDACQLENNTSYCWKVSARKSDGTFAESAYFNFTTSFQSFGCTDSNACNYDVCATQSNNSCRYEDCSGVCGGNKNPGSSCSDGNSSTTGDYYNNSCICVGKGCTDRNACNYNPNAAEDDGSCLKKDCRGVCGGNVNPGSPCTVNSFHDGLYNSFCNCKIKECKDPYACNYSPSAIVSNNCKYMNNAGICACQPDVTHKALNSSYKQSYSAKNQLISNINIYNQKDITYKAGKSVILNSGFRINAKANLTIQIKNCNP